MNSLLRRIVFAALCLYAVNGYCMTTLTEVIRADAQNEGLSETFLSQKIKEIVRVYIESQSWDQATKDRNLGSLDQILAGYTIRKIEDQDGAFLLKVTLNIDGSAAVTGIRHKVHVNLRNARSLQAIRMVNAVIEEFAGMPVFPEHVSAAESRWTVRSSFKAADLVKNIEMYLPAFSAVVTGDDSIDVTQPPR